MLSSIQIRLHKYVLHKYPMTELPLVWDMWIFCYCCWWKLPFKDFNAHPLVLMVMYCLQLPLLIILHIRDTNFHTVVAESSWQTYTCGQFLGFVSFIVSFTYFGFSYTYRIHIPYIGNLWMFSFQRSFRKKNANAAEIYQFAQKAKWSHLWKLMYLVGQFEVVYMLLMKSGC